MFQRTKEFFRKYGNIVFFVGGFLFDAFTLIRIDSIIDLSIQAFYLAGITFLLIAQQRLRTGAWTLSPRMAKWWEYETEIIHFFYGGLLSSYVVFYFKSTSASRSLIFFAVIAILMFANEMPQVRKAGSLMRLGLYAFCVVSFLNYLVPVIVGRMGVLIFILSWAVSAWLLWRFVKYLGDQRLIMAPAAIMVLIAGLYFLKLIPPVPLSLQYAGIYRQVKRVNGQFELTYRKPPWTRFWQKDDRVFLAQPGDAANCFVRVFAPRRFKHQIYMQWEFKNAAGNWEKRDRIPVAISGGRGEGFRGHTSKSALEPGRWRVEIETEDGRVLGGASFTLKTDDSNETPVLLTRRM